jgi:hypothetical protein
VTSVQLPWKKSILGPASFVNCAVTCVGAWQQKRRCLDQALPLREVCSSGSCNAVRGNKLTRRSGMPLTQKWRGPPSTALSELVPQHRTLDVFGVRAWTNPDQRDQTPPSTSTIVPFFLPKPFPADSFGTWRTGSRPA